MYPVAISPLGAAAVPISKTSAMLCSFPVRGISLIVPRTDADHAPGPQDPPARNEPRTSCRGEKIDSALHRQDLGDSRQQTERGVSTSDVRSCRDDAAAYVSVLLGQCVAEGEFDFDLAGFHAGEHCSDRCHDFLALETALHVAFEIWILGTVLPVPK